MTFVSGCCEGEICYCGVAAEHKVEETVFPDDPFPHRHPLTRYVCHAHFKQIMGNAACRPVTKKTDAPPVAVIGDARQTEPLEQKHPNASLSDAPASPKVQKPE